MTDKLGFMAPATVITRSYMRWPPIDSMRHTRAIDLWAKRMLQNNMTLSQAIEIVQQILHTSVTKSTLQGNIINDSDTLICLLCAAIEARDRNVYEAPHISLEGERGRSRQNTAYKLVVSRSQSISHASGSSGVGQLVMSTNADFQTLGYILREFHCPY